MAGSVSRAPFVGAIVEYSERLYDGRIRLLAAIITEVVASNAIKGALGVGANRAAPRF